MGITPQSTLSVNLLALQEWGPAGHLISHFSVCADPLRAAVYPLQFHWAGDARPAAALKIGCEDFDDHDVLAAPLEGAASFLFKNGSHQLKKKRITCQTVIY